MKLLSLRCRLKILVLKKCFMYCFRLLSVWLGWGLFILSLYMSVLLGRWFPFCQHSLQFVRLLFTGYRFLRTETGSDSSSVFLIRNFNTSVISCRGPRNTARTFRWFQDPPRLARDCSKRSWCTLWTWLPSFCHHCLSTAVCWRAYSSDWKSRCAGSSLSA